MRRIIPKSSKFKTNFFKSLSFLDLGVILVGLILILALLFSNLHSKWYIILGFLVLLTSLLVKFDDERGYIIAFSSLSYVFGKKHFSRQRKNISELQSIQKIANGSLYGAENISKVIEIMPTQFALLDDDEQDGIIRRLSLSLSALIEYPQVEIHIHKFSRPSTYDLYLFKNSVERNIALGDLLERGLMTEEEFEKRQDILANNEELFEEFNSGELFSDHFYMHLFFPIKKNDSISSIESSLEDAISALSSDLTACGLNNEILGNEELGIFVKNSYAPYFDERELYDNEDEKISREGYAKEEILERLMPDNVTMKYNRAIQDDVTLSYLTVTDYPLEVENAWGYEMFHIPNTRATMKLRIRDREKAIKDIDRSIMAIKVYFLEHQKDSEQNVAETHVATLKELLQRLQSGNDHLFDVNFHLTIYDKEKKLKNRKIAKKILNGDNIKSNLNYGKALECYLSDSLSLIQVGQNVGINSSSLAAVYPFVDFGIEDEDGVFIAESAGRPCMLDMFYRDGKNRVNSNAFVVGQSGMGKSYFTKTLFSQIIPNNTKVIVFDPEAEYAVFAKNVGGVSIDVSTSSGGRINPFQIISELEDDEGEENNELYSQLIFLESFFKTIMPSVNEDAFEYLNTVIVELYEQKGINSKTDMAKLTTDDFPVFEDLYKLIMVHLERAKSEYDFGILRTLKNHISKFALGGRYSGLWNGKTTLELNSNFINFNFRSLLVTENKTLANAQMLLILRYCNLEVMKNKELHERGVDRKIALVIDEAHVFFNKQFMVALNFMEQMARRIRKYYGMILFTTQNISDFLASPEIADKTKAIINACQYSFIFGLPANAINDLVELYSKSKPLNESEIAYIKEANRGDVFTILSARQRVGMKVVAPPYIEELFGEIKLSEIAQENETSEELELTENVSAEGNEKKEEEDTENT